MSDHYWPYVVTREDGSQSLISIFVDEGRITSVTLADRPDRYATWGIPEEATCD